jgi:hypothetical protein
MEEQDRTDIMAADSSGPPSEEISHSHSDEPSLQAPPPDALSSASEPSQDMPTIALIQAGLTVFNTVLLVVFTGLWLFAGDMLFHIFQQLAGICLLLAMAPLVLGGVILHNNKKLDKPIPGTIYATVGMWVGLTMAMMALIIPTLFTFRALFKSSVP